MEPIPFHVSYQVVCKMLDRIVKEESFVSTHFGGSFHGTNRRGEMTQWADIFRFAKNTPKPFKSLNRFTNSFYCLNLNNQWCSSSENLNSQNPAMSYIAI
jgi:hypothetical protein